MEGRTVSCGSLSKTYSITGWRLGYVIASPEIIAGARKVHDFLTVGAAAPLQEAAVAGLELPDSYYRELQTKYSTRRELFLGYLRQTGLRFCEPEGAYYVMVDIGETGWTDDRAFCDWLVKDVGVAAVPGSSFFRESVKTWIRFHFAKREETLHAAGQRLVDLRDRARNARESR
jgi:aminotransferase